MATYSGLWNGHYGSAHSLLSSSVKKGNAETQLARLLSNRLYGRAKMRALLAALTGDAVGETAAATHKRVQAVVDRSANVQGGVRTIETHTAVNRATTSADETSLDAALSQSSQPTYVGDAGGNGGGGKLGV